MDRTIFVGDVHGCLEELEALLGVLGVGAGDEVVLVGDLVAKGPDSPGVLRLARERRLSCVRGNHDQHLLRFLSPDEGGRPLKPLHRSIAERLDAADWAFLSALPHQLAFPALGVRAVHAGFVPGVPYDAQPHDAMILMRSLRSDGSWSKRIEDGVPWASLWPGPDHVVFGHDALRGLQQHPHATGLDTGCVYGGRLTALVLPERRLVSVPARRVWCDPLGPD